MKLMKLYCYSCPEKEALTQLWVKESLKLLKALFNSFFIAGRNCKKHRTHMMSSISLPEHNVIFYDYNKLIPLSYCALVLVCDIAC